jgi:hypothetical protein
MLVNTVPRRPASEGQGGGRNEPVGEAPPGAQGSQEGPAGGESDRRHFKEGR